MNCPVSPAPPLDRECIDAAREGQRRAEQQMGKTRERLEQQQASLPEMRMEAGHHHRELAERDIRLETLAAVANRDRMAIELATARGQLEDLGTAMQSLETWSTTAESHISALLAKRTSPATPRKEQGKLRGAQALFEAYDLNLPLSGRSSMTRDQGVK